MLDQGRVTTASAANRGYWVTAERAKSFALLFPNAMFNPQPAEIDGATPPREDVLLALVTGWMSHIGPVTATEISALLGLQSSEIEQALLRMEASGAILRGKFTDGASRAGAPAPHEPETEWCDRRSARSNPSADCRDAPQTNSAGDFRAVHEMAAALATCRSRFANAR